MKIKLSKEQISEIANEVISTISSPRMSAVPRTVAAVRIRLPGNEVALPHLDERSDDGVLLTVRADLEAIVQAIRNGSQKHALELSEHLLSHVEEVLAER